jgi:hypothetical protein
MDFSDQCISQTPLSTEIFLLSYQLLQMLIAVSLREIAQRRTPGHRAALPQEKAR